MAGARIVSGVAALAAAVAMAGVAAPAEAARRTSGPQQCAQGAWQQLLTNDGRSFRTPGTCARYAARGGPLRTNPYPQGKLICDQLPGATFTVTDTRYYTAWTCAWRAAELGSAENDRLRLACRTAGGDWAGEVPVGSAGMVAVQCIDSPDTPAG